MDYKSLIVYFIITFKILFIIAKMLSLYYRTFNKNDVYEKRIEILEYICEKSEFLFVFGVALLMINLFNPYNDKRLVITHEDKIIFFAYGILVLLSANWNKYFQESLFFSYLRIIIGAKKDNIEITDPNITSILYGYDT